MAVEQSLAELLTLVRKGQSTFVSATRICFRSLGAALLEAVVAGKPIISLRPLLSVVPGRVCRARRADHIVGWFDDMMEIRCAISGAFSRYFAA